MKRIKRVLALILCGAMLAENIPVTAFAEDLSQQGLCEHHPEHVECAYSSVEIVLACTHQHEADCYAVAEDCTHIHDDCGTDELPCDHQCNAASGCVTESLACQHQHDSECGYGITTDITPCDFVCTECTKQAEDQTAADKVAALIAALPALEVIKVKALTDQQEDYNQVQAAYDAYKNLSEDQKALLSDSEEVFAPYFEYFNILIMETDTSEIVSGTCGENLTWTLVDGVLTISGIGAMENYNSETDSPWYNYRSLAKTLIIEEGVTRIGERAFYECGSLTRIAIPQSTTVIESYAFYMCSSLTNITIPDGVTAIGNSAFGWCSSLTSINIPEGVASIGNYAFDRCTSLSSIAIPDGIKTIEYGAFSDCTSLSSIIIPKSVTTIEHHAFRGCSSLSSVTIPESVVSIEKYAFHGCSSLSSISIPVGITSIERHTFYQCSSLSSITIPENVTTIEYGAFSKCSSLTSITIPGGVTVIGEYAFHDCNDLTSIIFGGQVPLIGEGAFDSVMATACYPANNLTWTEEAMQNYGGDITWKPYCYGEHTVVEDAAIYATCIESGLTEGKHCSACGEVIVAQEVTPATGVHSYVDSVCEYCGVIGGTCGENLFWSFDDATGTLTISGTGKMEYYSEAHYQPWYGFSDEITGVIVQEGVTSIGGSAFRECYGLTNIDLPETLTRIDQSAFYDCEALTSIEIPDGVSQLGNYVFWGCETLKKVTLPEAMTVVNDFLFYDCSSLSSVTIPDGISEIGMCAFGNCTALTSVEIPDSVIFMDTAVFSGCTHLESVTLSSNIKKIDAQTFARCNNLKSITIPKQVNRIEKEAFRDNCSLEIIVFEGDACTIEENAFYNVTAIAYYPANNTTWTSDVTRNYGGSITWIPDGEEHTHEYGTGNKCECGAIGGTCGENLTWEFDEESGILTISGTGKMDNFSYPDYAPWFDYKEQIKTVDIKSGVTSIGAFAFMDYSNIKTITIPDSVTLFGDCVFLNCSSLLNITIPDGVTRISNQMFQGCQSLTSITIPDSVTRISQKAFSGCDGLTGVTIPLKVTNIELCAFSDCSNLSGIWVDENNTAYCNDSRGVLFNKNKTTLIQAPGKISGDYTVPDSVTSIVTCAFSGCGSLQNIELPDNLVELSWFAFFDCSSLKSITLPPKLTVIEDDTFVNCTSLTNVILPDKLTAIYDYAFQNCSSLENIELPETLNKIYYGAFYGCGSLTRITIPAGVTSIGDIAFYDCTALKEIIFSGDAPEFLVDVPPEYPQESRAFRNVTAVAYYPANNSTWTEEVMQDYGGAITWVAYGGEHVHEYDVDHKCECGAIGGTCGDNVTWSFNETTGGLAVSGNGAMPSIMNWSAPWNDFSDRIKTIELGDNITGIAPNAFMNCTQLEEIVIPQNMFTVGDQAFAGCSALSKVTFLGGCSFISENSFYGVVATVYYPAGYYQWQGNLDQYGGNLTWIEYGSVAKRLEFETFGVIAIPGNTFEVSVNESPWNASINCRFTIDNESVAKIVSSTAKNCKIEVLTAGTFTLTATDQNSGLTISKQFDARVDSISCPYSESFVVREGETTKYYSFTPSEPGEYIFKISMVTLAHPDAHRFSILDDNGQIVGGYIGGRIFGAGILAYGAVLEAERTYSVIVSYVDCIAESEERFSVEKVSDQSNIICIDEETVEIESGFSFKLIGAYVFPGCNDEEVKWEIGDESIVEFNTTGYAYSDAYYKSCRFQAKQAGSTTVTATYGNVQDSVVVTVMEPEINKLLLDTPMQVISNDGNNVSLEFTAPADGRYAFTAEGIGLRCDNAIGFMSADDDDNIVYGYGENSCKAYITMKSGETCTISISGVQICMNAAYEPSWSAVVTATCADDRPTSLKIKQLISRDGTIRLGAYFTPENYAEKVDWKVNDDNIIGRNHSDNDTFYYYNEAEYDVYASGQVTITATSESGLEDSVTLVLSEHNETIRQRFDDGILILSGNGAMDDYTYTLPPWDFYRYDITGVIVEEGITSISNRAFQNHTQIKTVKIADTVNTVGNVAFGGCSSLNEITFEGNAPLISFDAFVSVTATAYYPANNPTWTSDVMQDYGGNLTWVEYGAIENRVTIDSADLAGQASVWIDGMEYALQMDGDSCFVDLPDGNARTMVVHAYNSSSPNRYPISMKVWMLESEDGIYTVTRAETFDDILQYSGMSIRVTGKKGIRMITSMEKDKKNALVSGGLEGYTLKEYGTVVAWASNLGGGHPLVLGQSYAMSNHAYKKGVADPVFAYNGSLMQYTNVLVNFTDEQCKNELALRPYMILEDAEGEEITLYGGIVNRSIGYIAYQNRNEFEPGTEEYNYIWDIIHYVYGDVYDDEFEHAWTTPKV